MLVAVLKLRVGEKKLSKDELAAAVPMVGYMELVDTPERRQPRKREGTALLVPPHLYAVETLAELHRCEFGPWRRNGLILYGIEGSDWIFAPCHWRLRARWQSGEG